MKLTDKEVKIAISLILRTAGILKKEDQDNNEEIVKSLDLLYKQYQILKENAYQVCRGVESMETLYNFKF